MMLYLIFAVIVFHPGSQNYPSDMVLPLKRTYETQAECLSGLRAEIADRMNTYHLPSVNMQATHGPLCVATELSAPITKDEEVKYKQEIQEQIESQARGRDTLREFVK